ncbi:MAG: metal-dependent transcriptional regulator [Thermoanaerobaculia bacterium]
MQTWKSFAANEVTHSVAHYLTTLFELHARRGYARVSDVAKELDVTKGSVSVQMKHLKEKGLVVEDDAHHLRLTQSGEGIAREVMHKRTILIRFISTVLGVEPDRAEIDACKIEHLLSKETCHQLLALVQLLLSDEPSAQKFRERLREYKISCPSLENCSLCSVECLAEEDREVSSRLDPGDEEGPRAQV